MKMIRSIVSFLFSLLIVASSVSCAPRTLVESTNTPEPTQTATLSATPTATPSPEPTAALSPIPTATPIFSEERAAELDQQIQDFLNKEGNYSEESLTDQLLTGQSNEIFYKGERKLGLMDGTPRIQCWFFDYFIWEERLMLIVGLDGKSDERFVTLLEIPIYFYDKYEPGTFTFTQKAGNSLSGLSISVEPHCSTDQMIDYLDQLKNRPIIFTPDLEKSPDEWLIEAQSVGAYAVDFVNQLNSRVDVSRSLVANVFSNGMDYNVGDFNNAEFFRVNNISDLDKLDLSQIVMLSVDLIFSLR